MSKELKDEIKNNPKDWKCCHCQSSLPKRMSVTGGDAALRKGMLIICSACSKVNVLGDNELHPLTKEEFFSLDKPTQRAVLLASKGIKQLVDSGGSWNPFTKQ